MDVIEQLVPLEHLRAAEWAKEPHPPLVKTIVERFDPRRLGALIVSKRSDAEFLVIDGMERWEALLRLGVPEAPCLVLRGLTEKREAEIRMELSRQRQPFTSDDPAQRLRDAWAELRTLPLGGRGHLADACLAGAAEIDRLRGCRTDETEDKP